MKGELLDEKGAAATAAALAAQGVAPETPAEAPDEEVPAMPPVGDENA
jgi:hypothetical protein